MAKVTQIISNKISATQKLPRLDLSKCNSSNASWPSRCALRVNNPADIIQIFQADSKFRDDVLVTKFWTGSPADESLLSRGECVLVEIKDKSNLIFKNKSDELPADHKDNPKVLIPYDIAAHIGFSRLANVGVVHEKTEDFTCTMEKVDSEEECKGSTILQMNDQIFRLHTYEHDSRDNLVAGTSYSNNFNWKQSFLELFSFKMAFVMLLVRYGLGFANMKYNFMEGDLLKVWMKNAYMTIVDYFSHMP